MTHSPSSARPVLLPAKTSPLASAATSPRAARGVGGGFEGVKYRRDFAGNGSDFSAYRDCEAWLKLRGFSTGAMQDRCPTAVIFGEVAIAKWTRLSPEDREFLHGQIIASTGSFRSGPVVLVIRRDAPAAVIEAFLADDEDKAAQAHVEGKTP